MDTMEVNEKIAVQSKSLLNIVEKSQFSTPEVVRHELVRAVGIL